MSLQGQELTEAKQCANSPKGKVPNMSVPISIGRVYKGVDERQKAQEEATKKFDDAQDQLSELKTYQKRAMEHLNFLKKQGRWLAR